MNLSQVWLLCPIVYTTLEQMFMVPYVECFCVRKSVVVDAVTIVLRAKYTRNLRTHLMLGLEQQHGYGDLP